MSILPVNAIAAVVLVLWGCHGTGGMQMDAGAACPTHPNPTFDIGLSDAQGLFQSELMDGESVKMTPGSQGGCHLWLAFRSDGFVGRGIDVQFTIIDHDESNEQVVSMHAMVDFTLDPMASGKCEAGAFKAFMLKAKSRENHHVKLTVTLTDTSGATATKSVDNIVALWPDPIPGVDRAYYCGTM